MTTATAPPLTFELAGVDPTSAWGVSTWQPDDSGAGAVWAADTTAPWVDATCDLRGVTWTRGRLSRADRYGAAQLTAQLDNATGRWSAWSSASGLTLDASTPVRVTLAGRVVFTGRLDDLRNRDIPRGTTAGDAVDRWLELSATDGFAELTVAPGYVGSPPVEAAGARVNRLLDVAGWAGDRRVDAGTTTLAALTRATEALDELYLAADSEGGMFYIDDDGAARFADLATLDAAARAAPVAVFTDDATAGVVYADMVPELSRLDVVNRASIARTNGTEQVAVNLDSQARHGVRTFTRDDLIHVDDAHSADLAARIVARLGPSGPGVASLAFQPLDAPSATVAAALRLGDVVEVVAHAPGDVLDVVCQIDAISHAVTPGAWLVELTLSRSLVAYATGGRWELGPGWDVSTWNP